MKSFLLGLSIFAGLILLLGLIVFFGLGFYLSPQSKLAKADVIVAVSGGDTVARTEEATKLYKAGYAPRIIFAGAALDPESPSNAEAMARIATRAGVPADDIELEENSMDTRQNAAEVARIINQDQYKSVILVTSPYHQRRTYTLFRRALGEDFEIINHSSVDHDWRRSNWWATDYSRSLTISEAQKTAYELLNSK